MDTMAREIQLLKNKLLNLDTRSIKSKTKSWLLQKEGGGCGWWWVGLVVEAVFDSDGGERLGGGEEDWWWCSDRFARLQLAEITSRAYLTSNDLLPWLVVFAGGPVKDDKEDLKLIRKKFKDRAVDVVNFGEEDEERNM
ncbi:hypothetical protein Tco_1144359 [Tanacetum coccineum]